jgi:benzoyl-CoA reductase subunit D
MTITAGIDVGTGAVKCVLFDVSGKDVSWLGKRVDRVRRRDPMKLAEEGYAAVLEEAGLSPDDVDYVATTGDGENVAFRTGHFYSMTTHARGAVYLKPGIHAVLDIGALHGRGINIDPRGKVLSYKMTSQCASGSGQFLENIARYLGVAVDEIGEFSKSADDPEAVSGICAVLAETDVINMVSRGISTPNILKGIHMSMASRLVKLLKAIKVSEGPVLLTGGLALDTGLVAAIQEDMDDQKMDLGVDAHPDSIFAGAIGAALWGAFRHEKLGQIDQVARASHSALFAPASALPLPTQSPGGPTNPAPRNE